MKNIFFGMMLLSAATCSMAQLIETTLTCRVETIMKRKDAILAKKSETITVEMSQLNGKFIAGGYGELATVYGTNDSRSNGVDNINDRSSDSILDVDFTRENVAQGTGNVSIDDITFKLDRVSGKLKSSSTYKAMNARMLVTGNCEKANKKF